MQTAVKENVAEGSSLMTDEFAAYRGNRRNPIHDGQRFKMILSSVAGQRLIYKELTGKTLADARQA